MSVKVELGVASQSGHLISCHVLGCCDGAERLYRPGFAYQEAGIALLDPRDAATAQRSLFAPGRDTAPLMQGDRPGVNSIHPHASLRSDCPLCRGLECPVSNGMGVQFRRNRHWKQSLSRTTPRPAAEAGHAAHFCIQQEKWTQTRP